jgi:outer membrane protein assembly factor BamB
MYNTPPDSGFFQVVMWGRSDGETYQSTNILWEAPLPQALRFSCSQPVVVGDRIFVSADPSFVICYDKMTGKRLWIDYCGHYEFVAPEEGDQRGTLHR